MEDYEKPIPRQNCPACGGGIDCSIDGLLKGQIIEVGDPVICLHCGTILEVLPGLRFLARTDDEVRRRCSPAYFRQLQAAQHAVRTGGQLLAGEGPEGLIVESITPTDGRVNRDRSRN